MALVRGATGFIGIPVVRLCLGRGKAGTQRTTPIGSTQLLLQNAPEMVDE